MARNPKQAQPQFTIDPEFQKMMVPLTTHQRHQLETNLRQHGCRDPLVVWEEQNILIDGYNRYELCTRIGIEYAVKRVSLPNRDAARAWIRDNQLGRRNLMPEGMSYLRGKHYNDEKQAHGGAHKGKEAGDDAKGTKTEETLAGVYKVNAKTIRNDASFAKALDTIVANDKVHEAFKIAVLQREIKITRGQVKKLAKMDPKAQIKIAQAAVQEGKWPKKLATKKAKSITLPVNPQELAKKLLATRDAAYIQKVQEALNQALAESKKQG